MEPVKSASLRVVAEPEIEIKPLKAPVDPATLGHRGLRGGTWWQAIPAYRNVSEAEFLDHRFQMKHTITRPDKLLATVRTSSRASSTTTSTRGSTARR